MIKYGHSKTHVKFQIELHTDFYFETYWKYQPSISLRVCHCVVNNSDALQNLQYS